MIEVIRETVLITGFVFVMMLVIEYVNVLTSGAWQTKLAHNRWGQYFLAAGLGLIPGCLGNFAVVAMYSHRLLSLGAVVTAMIATSGDEEFVMLALVPKAAVVIFAACAVIGIAVGAAVDTIASRYNVGALCCDGLAVHEKVDCNCFDFGRIRAQWRDVSLARGTLATVLVLLMGGAILGQVEPEHWGSVRLLLIIVSAAALFIVATTPDHFLEEHLWRHVAKKHLPGIFLWTFGALFAMYLLFDRLHVDVEGAVRSGKWIVLVIACLIGLIPESGPHLIFVTLFARGAIPFSILLASSIVQDGHGMLPMLAQSRRAFVVIKTIDFVVGLAVGAVVLALGS